jgi:hypothetical protein
VDKLEKRDVILLLKSYKDIMPQIRDLNKEINEYLKLKDYCALQASTLSDMPKSHSVVHDKIGEVVARYEREVQGYVDKINILMDRKKLIDDMLFILEPIQRSTLIYRYIDNPARCPNVWEWVGNRINYECAQTRNIANAAIERIIKWYNT